MRNVAEILEGKAGVSGVQWLLRGRIPRAALRKALSGLVADADLLGSSGLRFARFKPPRRLSACLEVSVRMKGSRRSMVRAVSAVWKPKWVGRQSMNYRAPRVAELEADADRRGLLAPFQALGADAPAWGMRLNLSPLDERFPQLVRLSDPDYVREMLSHIVTVQPPAEKYHITTVRYWPDTRHVLRYQPTDQPGGAVYVKLYEDDQGAEVFAVTMALAHWLEENTPAVTCLRPLACNDRDRALLYPTAPGEPLTELLRRAHAKSEEGLKRSGAALKAFHSAPLEVFPPSLPGTSGFEPSFQEAAEASRPTRMLLPHVGEKVANILDAVHEIHERLPQEPSAVCHGDYKSEHVWVDKDKVTIIDLDLSQPGDPAYDLGKFLADLRLWFDHAEKSGEESAQEHFLEGYWDGAPRERLLRARAYEALELLKMTGRRVYLFEPDWSARTERLVDRAWKIVSQLQRSCGKGSFKESTEAGLHGKRIPVKYSPRQRDSRAKGGVR